MKFVLELESEQDECTLGTGDSSGVCVGDTTGDMTGDW